ncbi:MAG: ATP-binding cassette domain-containing protein [Deltaproteobacteria bacterium]|nr:ATP-binding cassette domain-containing protein [Deltaproteobacteria bacterium]MBW2053395.1 ATP-binding cassette domain-containing protein [Deltaproteobacteria bacterium]MBW2139514.1 ATP-binding cassette domain-containing protein [Deltaproteobacteria bacterium]MBW2322538.1 ATP-binding cassette domain-containing protein [Deltaproteobacteria bacterium]
MTEGNEIILKVNDLKVHFPIKIGLLPGKGNLLIKAVDGVSFNLKRGETLGLVGESGCGKSTTAKGVLQLHRPTDGQVLFQEQNLVKIKGETLRKARRHMQMIFQDPYACLNPRMMVRKIIEEPMWVHDIYKNSKERKDRALEMMALVGLSSMYANRYPHEFSGGQRQRIGIARALAVRPEFIVCDEPVSALDVSIQAQIINLLEDLRDKFNISYLFISHDLSVVKHISHRVAVMYLGEIVEFAQKNELYAKPIHPYTQALLSALPIPDPALEAKRTSIALAGETPSPIFPPSGCKFHPRCSRGDKVCSESEPEFLEVSPNHYVSCHHL